MNGFLIRLNYCFLTNSNNMSKFEIVSNDIAEWIMTEEAIFKYVA